MLTALMAMIRMMEHSPNHVRFSFLLFILVLNLDIAKKKRNTLGNPTTTDADGFLVDVDVQETDDKGPQATREDKRRDVDQFFHSTTVRDVNGKKKSYRACKLCP